MRNFAAAREPATTPSHPADETAVDAEDPWTPREPRLVPARLLVGLARVTAIVMGLAGFELTQPSDASVEGGACTRAATAGWSTAR
ncbi:MAG: hypothetical protein ACR2K3_07140 [Nocardioides sp.]